MRRRYFDAFRRLEGRDDIRIVNADRTPDEVAEEIFAAVKEILT